MQHSVPADTVPVSPTPWGKSQQGGRQGPRSWRCPEWVRTVPGASSCAGGGGLGGTRRAQAPFSSPEQPFPPLMLLPQRTQLSLAPGRAPGAWFSCKDWKQTTCPRLCRCSVCPAWQDGSKGAGSASQKDPGAGAVQPCPSAAGGHQQLLSLAWSSSTQRPRPPRVDKPPRDAAAHRTHSLPQEAWEWHCLEQP